MARPLEKDFDAFPPAVKRKYFSTLERLRLAQESVSSVTAPLTGHEQCRIKAPRRSPLPCLNRNLRCRASSNRRFGKSPSCSPIDFYSPADAQWFMSLPDKVQKTQFTREEQLLLGGRYETVIPDPVDGVFCNLTVIPDAADEVFCRFGHQRNQSVPTLRNSSVSSQSSCGSLGLDCFSDSDSDMDEAMMDSFRWMDEDEDLDLTLDDYHIHMASTTESSTKNSSRRPSFHKSPSVTNIPLGRPSMEASPDPPRFTGRRPSNAIPHIFTQYAKPNTSSKPASPATINFPPKPPTPTHSSQTPRHIIETSARHYQDPEARLKLRVYLASPQKFDEAIEFGFPSLVQAKEIHIPPSRPSPPKHQHPAPTPLTWFNDDKNPSVSEAMDSDSDTASLPQTPCTPDFREPHMPSPRNFISTDADALHPRKLPFKPYHHVLSGQREMTLRMTLTRPDLRKDDDQPDSIYGDGDEDPFALEHLPSLGITGDIWDSLPLHEGVVKKLWQKVSRRGGGV
ncbi:hypothetical protein MMC07_008495 [Pseudocyphellaria aurata]|nr:hypothetical protein [Pseudocyphellaria aurata]